MGPFREFFPPKAAPELFRAAAGDSDSVE